MASPPPVARPASSWPPVVLGALDSRRRAVAAEARGRVLDLGQAGPSLESYRLDAVDAITLVEPDADLAAERTRRAEVAGLDLDVVASLDELGGETYDTVISVLGLAAHADLPGALSVVVEAMGPDASLTFVEPTSGPGVLGPLTTPLTAWVPTLAPFHLHRDVPSAVRAHGLTVIAIERFTMPTLIWPLRPFAHATARRITAAAAGPTGRPAAAGSAS